MHLGHSMLTSSLEVLKSFSNISPHLRQRNSKIGMGISLPVCYFKCYFLWPRSFNFRSEIRSPVIACIFTGAIRYRQSTAQNILTSECWIPAAGTAAPPNGRFVNTPLYRRYYTNAPGTCQTHNSRAVVVEPEGTGFVATPTTGLWPPGVVYNYLGRQKSQPGRRNNLIGNE